MHLRIDRKKELKSEVNRMLQKYEIHGIEPFSDVFYKNCAYNPLITGINYCGGSIYPFLSNDFFTYTYNETEGFKLNNNNIQVRPESEVIKNMGILFDYNIDQKEILEDIKKATLKNIPVYVPIDRYYWSNKQLNSPYYKTKHHPHYFLIYGFDNQQQEFCIFDTDGTKTFGNKINYTELMECYDGFCEFRKNETRICKLVKQKDLIHGNTYIHKDTNRKVYKENFLNKKDILLDGLKNIKKAMEYYSNKSNLTLILNEDQWETAVPFFFIQMAKKAQLYQVNVFFEERKEIVESIKMVIDYFNIVQGLLLKTLATQKYSEITMNGITSKLEQIYQLELNYYYKLEDIFHFDISESTFTSIPANINNTTDFKTPSNEGVANINITNCISQEILYSDGWSFEFNKDGNNSMNYLDQGNGYALFSFLGTSISYVATKNKDCGYVDVYIDGTKVETVNLYSPDRHANETVFNLNNLSNTYHIIRIESTGEKDILSLGFNINLNSFRCISEKSSDITMIKNKVEFIGIDKDTQGSWKTVYGSEGYDIIGSTKFLPSYIYYNFNGALQYVWATGLTDIRALQEANNKDDRVAGCKYNNPSFNIELLILSNDLKNVTLYLLDYDTFDRKVCVEILDIDTGTILHTYDLDNYHDGIYLKYQMKGRISVKFLCKAGGNATLSGIFFE